MPSEVFKGRYTVPPDQSFVVFVIGMRVNQWWKLHKWIPVAMAMPRMLFKLSRDKSLGLLSYEQYFRLFPFSTSMVSYWKSFEHLESFAKNPDLPHAKAWADFFKRVGFEKSVGIFHESYRVGPGQYECIFTNMPRHGLSGALEHVEVSKARDSARERMR